MIFPCPEDFKNWLKYPLTLTLAFANIFIFFVFFSDTSDSWSQMHLLEKESLIVTGRLYTQFSKSHVKIQQDLPTWLGKVDVSDDAQMEVMGALGLRDGDFLKQAATQEYTGDVIEIATWRKEMKSFQEKYFSQALFRFGLSSMQKNSFAWITYQFSHSGFVHLLSNLVFLFVMGFAVEALVGSVGVLLIYIVGGIAGGLGFLLINGHGAIPMVGASAAVSALLSFYCIAETRKRVRFAYFISPIEGQYGFIYLPTLLIFPLFLLTDFASLLSTPEGLGGGVAYSAHIGGSIIGALMAVAYRFMKSSQQNESLNQTQS
jgi:membrane associated rhomboid family serine protease